jgi:hypothetical protein
MGCTRGHAAHHSNRTWEGKGKLLENVAGVKSHSKFPIYLLTMSPTCSLLYKQRISACGQLPLTVEMEFPKVERCLSNCASPTPDSVPTPTNLKLLSLTNSTPNVDERVRRRAISGLLCFFAVGWGDASGYTLSFHSLYLIEDFSYWGSSPLHPRGI